MVNSLCVVMTCESDGNRFCDAVAQSSCIKQAVLIFSFTGFIVCTPGEELAAAKFRVNAYEEVVFPSF